MVVRHKSELSSNDMFCSGGRGGGCSSGGGGGDDGRGGPGALLYGDLSCPK